MGLNNVHHSSDPNYAVLDGIEEVNVYSISAYIILYYIASEQGVHKVLVYYIV